MTPSQVPGSATRFLPSRSVPTNVGGVRLTGAVWSVLSTRSTGGVAVSRLARLSAMLERPVSASSTTPGCSSAVTSRETTSPVPIAPEVATTAPRAGASA